MSSYIHNSNVEFNEAHRRYRFVHTHTHIYKTWGQNLRSLDITRFALMQKPERGQNIYAFGRIYLERLTFELCSCFLKESYNLSMVPTSKGSWALLPTHETELQMPGVQVSAPAEPPEVHWATLADKQAKIAKHLSSQDTALQSQM